MAENIFPIEDWFLNLPLYRPIQVEGGVRKAIEAILTFEGTMDSFCPECQQSATFIGVISKYSESVAQEAKRSIFGRHC